LAERIRVGVVGTSWWTDPFHLAKLKEVSGADLAAVCGRNRSRAEEMAAKYAIPQVYTDYQDMIEHGNLQALVVAAPDDLHYPITMAALDAGLHVFCEKPLASNTNQAKAMMDKAEQMGVKHMVCYTFRYFSVHRYLHELIGQGYLGRIYQINFRHMFDYGPDFVWRFDKSRANGILGDLGSHMIDMARWLVGEIAQVSGQRSSFITRTGPDGQTVDSANDAATLALRFVNGAQGVIQVNAVAQVTGEDSQVVTLFGEEGTLEGRCFKGEDRGEVRGFRRGDKNTQILENPYKVLPPDDPISSVPLGHRSFIDSILFDRVTEPTFLDGYRAQQVIDAAIQSDNEGKWITIQS
jgi:predicted dehydrogenase